MQITESTVDITPLLLLSTLEEINIEADETLFTIGIPDSYEKFPLFEKFKDTLKELPFETVGNLQNYLESMLKHLTPEHREKLENLLCCRFSLDYQMGIFHGVLDDIFAAPPTELVRDFSKQQGINQTLIRAIKALDVEVQRWLRDGADSNHTWTHGLVSKVDQSIIQPTSPLGLVIFMISDCMLIERNLSDLYEIIKILLEYYANPEPAYLLAVQRYGKYKETETPTMFDEIYRLVVEAYCKSR
ncbi:MAG: hypothetical protein GF411_12450 [Candidatus Lokiarchaeota archaeon]|nr:hypothetical protein [Candidatus Lokiarchaeota archaeon]